MHYKALITDLDRTLIAQATYKNAYALPSKKVQQAIKKAKNSIHIGIATNRPLLYADYLFSHLKLSGPSILQGGALIVDSATRKILFKKALLRDDYFHIASLLKKHHIKFVVDEVEKQAITTTCIVCTAGCIMCFCK